VGERDKFVIPAWLTLALLTVVAVSMNLDPTADASWRKIGAVETVAAVLWGIYVGSRYAPFLKSRPRDSTYEPKDWPSFGQGDDHDE
jgi:hypothetical protein